MLSEARLGHDPRRPTPPPLAGASRLSMPLCRRLSPTHVSALTPRITSARWQRWLVSPYVDLDSASIY